MSTATIASLGAHDDRDVIAYVVAAQDDPTRHVPFVGESPVAVQADLAQAVDWRARTLVARDATGAVVGVLTVDVDEDLGRLWWLGPWADDRATAAALVAAGDGLAPTVHEREFAPDARNTALAELAVELGYHAVTPSAVLVADLTTRSEVALPEGAGAVRAMEPGDRAHVARLHDRLFPGTHTPGHRLVDDAATSVLVVGTPPVGYVATQVQADGATYVDFLGVAEDARGRGHGRTLVAAAVARAADAGGHRAFLTVHVDNAPALALYRSLGFVEERRIAPFRRGPSRDG